MAKYKTIKDLKEWASKFPDNEVVYLGSFNSLCGGGNYRLTSSIIDIRDDVMKTGKAPYISSDKGEVEEWDPEDLLQQYREEELLPSQVAQNQRDCIEANEEDWNEEKLTKEKLLLEDLEKQGDEGFIIGKQVPVIFVNN